MNKKNKDLNFNNLIEQANALILTFAEHDPKPWPITVKTLDLVAHSGGISTLVLEVEGYKEKTSRDTLSNELATLFFIILDIAKEYQIDFKESFSEFLENTSQHLIKEK